MCLSVRYENVFEYKHKYKEYVKVNKEKISVLLFQHIAGF